MARLGMVSFGRLWFGLFWSGMVANGLVTIKILIGPNHGEVMIEILDGCCACGRELHYTDTDIKTDVDRMIETSGSAFVTIVCEGRRYRVQKHYIALHGLKGRDLLQLAQAGMVDDCTEGEPT